MLLLGECVPMFAGTPDEQAALTEFIELLPKLFAMIEIICPEMPEGDRQLVGESNVLTKRLSGCIVMILTSVFMYRLLPGVDMAISDFLHEPKEEREKFLPWVESKSIIIPPLLADGLRN